MTAGIFNKENPPLYFVVHTAGVLLDVFLSFLWQESS